MVNQDKIHIKIKSSESEERRKALKLIGYNFAVLPDKKQAWEDLHQLTKDEDSLVRWDAAEALIYAFQHIPEENKKQAWEDLIRLAKDEDSLTWSYAARALGEAFPHIPEENRKQAWEDLHQLTKDEDSLARLYVPKALGEAFPHIPEENRKQAWEDLIRLTEDKESTVRWDAAEALIYLFQHIPEEDKKQAWEDLIRLAKDEDKYVRWFATFSLGKAYQHIPEENRKQAWEDLHQLTQDEKCEARRDAAEALVHAFPHIPEEDKKQAWEDLIRLAKDEDSDVRAYANNSLGWASIFRATVAESEEKFREELEKALEFFEKSSAEESYPNPAEFCLPFYRSFYMITFGKQEAEAVVQKYIAEAKAASRGSESAGKLLEAVENLANALRETRKLKESDLETMQHGLQVYRRYCDRAAELLESTKEKAPGATKIVKRGLPIIDQRITSIITEVKEKARAICLEARGSPLEALGLETSEKARQLSILNYLSLEVGLEGLAAKISEFCEYIPSSEKKAEIRGKIETTKSMDAEEKIRVISEVFDDLKNNIEFPRIKDVFISKREKEIVRIATVQLDFELLTDSFPPVIKDKEATKAKVLKALKIAKDEGANIVCLPELCVCEDWLCEIKNRCVGMIIIPGSYYDKENHNLCRLILDSDEDVPTQLKIKPSDFEDSVITKQRRMVSGENLIYAYETRFGKFAVLICRDFGNFIRFLRGRVDMVFVPSFNPAVDRFHMDAHTHVTSSPSYVIISNAALYGGTSIYGQLHNKYFKTLEHEGCKEKGDASYRLCEIEKGKEGLIIADFNLVYKMAVVQTPTDPAEDINPVKNIRKIVF
nr:HEAT repeat domain-containing protein [Candidatus Freyarchaeota archaeon]